MKSNKINTCEVVRDLLPLVVDNVSSDESRRLVCEHISVCESCAKYKKQLTETLGATHDLTLDSGHNANTEDEKRAPEREFLTLMKRLAGRIFLTALLIAALVLSFCANIYGAWMGHPAEWWNFVITLVYIGSVSLFIVQTRYWMPFVKVSRFLSGLSLLTSVYCTICRSFKLGGFLSAFLSVHVSIPFYGLRWFMSWDFTYITAAFVCAAWFVLSGRYLKKLRWELGED